MKTVLSFICVFFIFTLISEGFSASLPNKIKPCKLSSAPQALNQCIKEAAQKFLPILRKPNPELGLPSFEPLKIPDIQSTDSILNFKFTNNKVVGFTLPSTKIEDFKLDQIKKRFTITYVNSGHMESDYSLDGHLLLLPINGKGKSIIRISGLKNVYKFKYDVVTGKDGLTYWKIVQHNVNLTPENMSYSFTNLFNGNKVLSDVILQLANDNWKEIHESLGKPSLTIMSDAYVAAISKLFTKVPVDQLFTA